MSDTDHGKQPYDPSKQNTITGPGGFLGTTPTPQPTAMEPTSPTLTSHDSPQAGHQPPVADPHDSQLADTKPGGYYAPSPQQGMPVYTNTVSSVPETENTDGTGSTPVAPAPGYTTHTDAQGIAVSAPVAGQLQADTNSDGQVSSSEALGARSEALNAAYGLGGSGGDGSVPVTTLNPSSPLQADANGDNKVSATEALGARSQALNQAYGLGTTTVQDAGVNANSQLPGLSEHAAAGRDPESDGPVVAGSDMGNTGANLDPNAVFAASQSRDTENFNALGTTPSPDTSTAPTLPGIADHAAAGRDPESSQGTWSGNPNETQLAPAASPSVDMGVDPAIKTAMASQPAPAPVVTPGLNADAVADVAGYGITLPPSPTPDPAQTWQALNPPVDSGNQTGHGFVGE